MKLDKVSRTKYRTAKGFVYVLDGTQDFSTNQVIVWVDNKVGYKSCPIIFIPDYSSDGKYRGTEIAFKLYNETIYFSPYMNGNF